MVGVLIFVVSFPWAEAKSTLERRLTIGAVFILAGERFDLF
jgi:hypothetical protein